MLKEIKKQSKKEQGITLISLVITIIVLLILAGVVLATLTGDSGILSNAEKAKEKTQLANAKEQIQLAVQSALVDDVGTLTKEKLELELKNILGEKVSVSGEADGPWTVENNGIEFQVTEKGNVEEIKETIIVVPEIGDYVTYNVTYTDMFTDYEFTATNGWRILDKGIQNSDGTSSNVKLISTGTPAMLHYSYNTNTDNAWWGTDAQVAQLYGEEYATGIANYAARYAAAGLLENFASVPFTAGTSATANNGYFKKINSTFSGNITGDIFKTTEASKVYILTFEELNIARGLAEDASISTEVTDGDTGLFNMRKLVSENSEYGYTKDTLSSYWNATSSSTSPNNLRIVTEGGVFYSYSDSSRGIRPVIVLSSKIRKVSDGQWEIVK